MAQNVTHLPSIQGEQQQDTGIARASDEVVDDYVDRVSDEVLECRERGRHLFPSIRAEGIQFTAVDDTGLFVRRLTCVCCRLAVRVEKWEALGRGRSLRFRRVAAQVEYRRGPEGETYLAPSGQGRMTPRQIADSVASKALKGQSVAALRKALERKASR